MATALPLPALTIRGRSPLPIVQGGMGVGISAHRLAGSVARLSALGTIASVDLRRKHRDLMEMTRHCREGPVIDRANLVALEREIAAAKAIAGGHGMLAANVMRAVTAYASSVRRACESGIDAIVMGAGLPLDLPELTADFPEVALIPILSDARGISLVIRKWARKHRLPDAIVVEHPRYAGGHLGAASVADLADPRFDFERAIPEALEVFHTHGIAPGSIPLIAAGGIDSHARVVELIGLGASGVQLGTAFAVTREGDAAEGFKATLANAKPEDIVEFMSVAGLPARAVRTRWLDAYLKHLPAITAVAHPKPRCTLHFDCLIACGLRDGVAKMGQFCIDEKLAAAVRGDVRTGLFFRGASALPFGSEIRPVRDLIDFLMTGRRPDTAAA